MPELTVIARTVAKPGTLDKLRAEMAKLVEPTRREPGCLEYVMHCSLEDPSAIVFYERWESAGHLQAHTETAHFRTCMAAIAEMTERVEIERLEEVVSP